jgi:hypothetical protein
MLGSVRTIHTSVRGAHFAEDMSWRPQPTQLHPTNDAASGV